MPPTIIRLGTASPGTRATTAETLSQLEHFARRAAAKKIDILLLPEAYIGGYPRGTHFGCVIGNRSKGGREEYLRYFQSAIDLGDTVGDGAGAGDAWVNRELPGDAVSGSDDGKVPSKRGDGTREELERIARDTGVFVATGLIEKTGGSLYCSVVYVCPKLGIIGKRRKVMPTGTERLVWAQGSPATLRAVSTTIRGVRINLAAAICWENYMPLVRQAIYSQNINLYLAPTADGRDTWLSLLRTTAIEGRCFVISSNMCTRSTPALSANGHTTIHHQSESAVDTDGAELDPSPFPHCQRRQSVFDEDGNEIALPCTSPVRPASSTQRRESVFDEDGNEIVLPCSHPLSSQQQQEQKEPRARERRQSVYDEDGNEIVLCCSKKKPTTTTTTSSTTTTQPTTTKGDFTSRGGSAIVSPFGDVLAGPQWEDDQGIVYADVDFDDCIRGRLDLDTAGSYSRNDSFRFEVRGLELRALPY
ncbi:hypothetical protein N0V88_000629 [Collariella sp. IMI 366227]|nr:hypothetical protein N0V88_000629 [Collariella sp. IMI 366227]